MGAGLSRETERRQRQRKRLLRLRAAPYSGACTHDDALMGVNYSWSRGSQRGSRRGNGEKSVENGFTNLRRMSAVATVAFRLRPQSGTHRLFIGPTAKGRSGSIWSVRRAVGERPLFARSGHCRPRRFCASRLGDAFRRRDVSSHSCISRSRLEIESRAAPVSGPRSAAITREAEAREAEQHERPGRGLRNSCRLAVSSHSCDTAPSNERKICPSSLTPSAYVSRRFDMWQGH